MIASVARTQHERFSLDIPLTETSDNKCKVAQALNVTKKSVQEQQTLETVQQQKREASSATKQGWQHFLISTSLASIVSETAVACLYKQVLILKYLLNIQLRGLQLTSDAQTCVL